jgi:hypothetical protein
LCAAQGSPFVLGHALSMQAIHGGKAKNDKSDGPKITVLLYGGMLPQAYVYPAAIKHTLAAHGIDLPFPTPQILLHDQTEATDGGRARQRGGWPAGTGKIPPPRSVASVLGRLTEAHAAAEADAPVAHREGGR